MCVLSGVIVAMLCGGGNPQDASGVRSGWVVVPPLLHTQTGDDGHDAGAKQRDQSDALTTATRENRYALTSSHFE